MRVHGHAPTDKLGGSTPTRRVWGMGVYGGLHSQWCRGGSTPTRCRRRVGGSLTTCRYWTYARALVCACRLGASAVNGQRGHLQALTRELTLGTWCVGTWCVGTWCVGTWCLEGGLRARNTEHRCSRLRTRLHFGQLGARSSRCSSRRYARTGRLAGAGAAAFTHACNLCLRKAAR